MLPGKESIFVGGHRSKERSTDDADRSAGRRPADDRSGATVAGRGSTPDDIARSEGDRLRYD